MIPTLRLPAVLTATALLLGSGVSLRAADDAAPSASPAVTVVVTPAPAPDPEAAARRKTAETLLDTLHMQATVDMASKRMLQSVDQVADRMEKQPNATPEASAEAKKLREELHTLITQGLGWETVKPDLVQAYADDFTVAELKEVDAFYHTPVGQKLVDKQPALTEKLGKTMQQRSMALIPAIRQKIQAATAKTRPTPPPAPSPAGTATAPVGLPSAAPVTTSPVPAPTAAAASATPTAPPAGTPKSITPVMPVTPAPM